MATIKTSVSLTCWILELSFSTTFIEVPPMSDTDALLPPGFRFHPTDEELILHYLRNQVASSPCPVSIIAEIDIYKFDPWDLPAKAIFGAQEWYFFSPRDRKYPKGVRPNRACVSGYWKATGTDKPIHTSSGSGIIGVKKGLVFYKGWPQKGLKTSWIMHEYCLTDAGGRNRYKSTNIKNSTMRLDDWVLCRIYKKNKNQDGLSSSFSTAEGISAPENTSPKPLPKFPISDVFLDDYSAMLDDPPFGMTGQVNGYTEGSSVAKQPFNARYESTSWADQFDVSQSNIMNLAVFNELILLNSNLGLN